jgi:histidinol-phosphate aminotransferase
LKRLAKKTIFNVQPYVPGKPIEEVKRELGLTSVIKLASNENPYGPSPQARKAILNASSELHRYPDGNCHDLRKELSRRLKVRPDQFIFGNGSDEIIVLAVRIFAGEGDEVVIARPSFLIYDIASRIAGANVKAVPLKDFAYDLDAMKAAVTKRTKIVFLGNPDNPGGRYLTRRQLTGFLKGLRKDILIFIDEAYYEYVEAPDYVDSIGLMKRHKNIIVTRTFSKMYGLAGLRIGYGIADGEIIDCFNRIREPFNVNALAQAAALACLKDRAYYRNVASKIRAQRRFLYGSLKTLGLKYVESYTNFILIEVQKDASLIANALLRRGVIIRDMRFWGLDHFIRVTIGTEAENRKFLLEIKELL